MKLIGIYGILNKITKEIYIGQSIDIKKRFRFHKWQLIENRHDNNFLQNGWNKYGASSFKFIILENVKTCLFLTAYEVSYIQYYKNLNRSF